MCPVPPPGAESLRPHGGMSLYYKAHLAGEDHAMRLLRGLVKLPVIELDI